MQPEKTGAQLSAKHKAPSSVDQWDIVASQLIKQELAPKGYSEIKTGDYRGKVKSNIHFLPKQSVIRCQNISAQLVRAYREEVRAFVQGKLDYAVKVGVAAAGHSLPWWRFKERRSKQKEYEHYRDQSGLLQIIINQLDQIKVPTK